MTPGRESPFDVNADQYDRWFDENEALLRAEVEALRRFVAPGGPGLEIGVGSGRFAEALGIGRGIDPSRPMLARAAARGIQVVQGVAEALPFGDATFAIALVNTAVCFMDDVEAAFAEAARVLMPGGRLVVGMIDGDSWLGRRYRAEAARDVFYAAARFRSVAEVRARMADAALTHVGCAQTVFQAELPGRKATDVTSGSGRGGYAVVCGERASMRRMP